VKLFRSCFSACLALALSAVALGQSWQPLTNQPSFTASLPVLMRDGSVLVHDLESPNWWRYTPDPNGDYLNGTWTQVASLPFGYAPLYYATTVLPDGRLAIQGGEYNVGGSPVWTNQGAIYDPVANTWTALNPPSGWDNIGDAQSVLLPDGTWMIADPFDKRIAKFNAGNLTWSAPTNNNKQDRHDEEGWTLLPDGTILTVDCGVNLGRAEKYIPWTGDWVDAGAVPVQLPDADSEEMGPQVLMFDGRVMCFGASGHNAIYTPPATPTDPGTWTIAPDFPVESGSGERYDIADGPAVLLTNGKILCAASPGVFQAPTAFFEFDGANLSQVDSTPNAPFEPSFVGNFLMLPSGQVMFTDFSGDVEIYTSTGGPNDAWRPTISDAPDEVALGGTYTLTGTQLNGFSQTNAYGDDWQNFSNYPIVRITNSTTGHISYCPTINETTSAIATNGVPITTSFSIPADIETGDSTLQVVANGIASDPRAIRILSVFLTKDLTTSAVITFGGTPFTATMELFDPAGPGGVTVNLQSSNPALIVPPTVTVPEGADHVDFQINTLNDSYGIINASVTETFGGEPSHTISVPVYPGNRALFISQTVPSTMQVGNTYTVTLTYKNNSNITWDTAHGYKLQSRNANNNTIFGKNRIPLTNAPVPPGGTGIFQTTMSPTGGSGTGFFNFQWLPIEEAISAGFGSLSPNLSVQITRLPENAKFISQNIPLNIFAGNDFTPHVTMTNTGTNTWSAGGGYFLSTINPTANTTWRSAKMLMGATSIVSTGTMAFSTTCTAPVTPGDYTMQWQMSKSGTLFGDTTTLLIIHVTTGLDNSNFLSQTVPKSVGPGVTFSASMTMKNVGTGVWDSTYALVPISGTGFSVKKIPSSITSPGGTSAFIQTFTAPAIAGTYLFQWRMAHNGVQFGQSTQSVTITVSAEAAQFVSKIVGTSIPAGSDFTPNFTMRNTGTTTWRQSTGYALVSQNALNNTTWGTNRLLIPSAAVITTNQSVICSNACTAPITPGTYTMQWQMSHNGVLFGEVTPLVTITVTAAADNAQFVTQSGIPATIARGGTFQASITMKNIGTSTWDANYAIVPVGDSSFGIASIGAATTAPNGNKVFTATFTAPAVAGNFKFSMRMRHTSTKFGQASPVVTIHVT
jgi:hypothetical protein